MQTQEQYQTLLQSSSCTGWTPATFLLAEKRKEQQKKEETEATMRKKRKTEL